MLFLAVHQPLERLLGQILVLQFECHVADLLIEALQEWVNQISIQGLDIIFRRFVQILQGLLAVAFLKHGGSLEDLAPVDKLVVFHQTVLHHNHFNLLDLLGEVRGSHDRVRSVVHVLKLLEQGLDQEDAALVFGLVALFHQIYILLHHRCLDVWKLAG